MRAGVYARYSSENQRPESIEDQVAACKRLAAQKGFTVLEEHIYADEAKSGARKDRAGLEAAIKAAAQSSFEVLLVDDLSRLARDNYLMLSIMAELHFAGVRVVSVADGLDSNDEEATLGIQIRGVFNELQLRDLKCKTLRGQIGQKQRGYCVGERTFGYRSVPVGEMRMDKKGRPRPDGYRMEIDPREAAVVLRIFKAYADGASNFAIVKALNAEGVPGRFKSSGGWSPATVMRILDNEKYAGRWVWNKSETRRDPKTCVKRRFPKPESEWIVQDEPQLRIVPQEVWDAVRERRAAVAKSWPGGKRRGFSAGQGGRQKQFPTHLLSGTMVCSCCGGAIAQVSGKGGGYYGCLAASKRACENRVLVRRKLTEQKILGAVREQLSHADVIHAILRRVGQLVASAKADLPETVKLREAEFTAEQRRLSNFIDFVGEGRGSKALAKALEETERRVESLELELASLRRGRDKVFQAPTVEWIEHRVGKIQEVLEKAVVGSATLLRELLGPITLEPVRADIGSSFYRAKTALDTLALIDAPVPGEDRALGSNSLRWWALQDLNL